MSAAIRWLRTHSIPEAGLPGLPRRDASVSALPIQVLTRELSYAMKGNRTC